MYRHLIIKCQLPPIMVILQIMCKPLIFCKWTLVEFVDFSWDFHVGFLSLPAMTPVSQHDPDTGLLQ